MNILWVENHPHFAPLMIQHYLADHAVTVVPSLAAARQALGAASFEAVLIDFDLDDGKGTELVRALQQVPQRPWLIATSAHEDGNQALREAGVDAVCGKLQFRRIGGMLAELRKPKGQS